MPAVVAAGASAFDGVDAASAGFRLLVAIRAAAAVATAANDFVLILRGVLMWGDPLGG
jgi:hypothetical protein